MENGTPEGFNTATPSLIFKDTAKAIETYKKAFNAKVIDIFKYPDSDKIMHAVIEIGNTKFMLGDETPEMKAGSGINFYLYVPNCDAAMKQAVDAGLKETMPADDMFWGDRLGSVKDEYGVQWSIATNKKQLTKEEVDEGAREFMKNWEAKKKGKAA